MGLLSGVGKRQHATVYWGKEKRLIERENTPFVPVLTVDIATGHVEQHRDIWRRERSVGA